MKRRRTQRRQWFLQQYECLTQPWVFHVTADRNKLFTDPTRRIVTIDPANREHHIGLGCAFENLVLASVARDFRATVTLFPKRPDHPVATVDLTRGRTYSPRTTMPLPTEIAIGVRTHRPQIQPRSSIRWRLPLPPQENSTVHVSADFTHQPNGLRWGH